MRLNVNYIDDLAHQEVTKKLKGRKSYNEKTVDAIFDKVPKIFYKYEPFEFYGGNFEASQKDKTTMCKDAIYRAQEAEIVQLKSQIELLQ